MRVFARAAVALALLALPASAQAAYPGSNGKLAFVRDGQIWTMNPDGTGATQLPGATSPAADPQWSPNGSEILYRGPAAHLHVIESDGSGDRDTGLAGSSPTWAPDGKRIAYMEITTIGDHTTCCFTVWLIRTADPDGSHKRTEVTAFGPMDDYEWSPKGDQIANDAGRPQPNGDGYVSVTRLTQPVSSMLIAPTFSGVRAYGPAWSPDAASLTYLQDTEYAPNIYDVLKADADGSNPENLTVDEARQFEAEWSPDGSKIVFTGEDPALPCASGCNAELWVMNPDGTDRVRLTTTSASESDPDWQPVVGPRPPGYPRPRGATPFRVSLVPAYNPCAAPNRTHGAPLSFPSCAPPAQASSHLTVGTPDANGAGAAMLGSLRIDAIPGNSSTPSNETDAKVKFSVTDVRCYPGDVRSACTTENAAGGRDYGGGVRVETSLRLTDRYNLPAPAGDLPGTTVDAPIDLNVGCQQTASDATLGSTCSYVTSIGALIGATEGRRAVYQLGQVVVLDGGATGAVGSSEPSSGMSPFLRQGLFIP
jgi:hypothetical protein